MKSIESTADDYLKILTDNSIDNLDTLSDNDKLFALMGTLMSGVDNSLALKIFNKISSKKLVV